MKGFKLLLVCLLVCSSAILGAQESAEITRKRPGTMRNWNSYGSIYLLSQSISETLPNSGGDLKSFNLSPISLSLTNSYRMTEDKQFVWTGYWTYYLNTKIDNGTGTEVKIAYPSEYGFNFYYRQTLPSHPNTSIFGGFDIESFSFLDTQEFLLTSNLTFNRHNLYFATIGASHSFFWSEHIINFKGGFSHILSSTTSGKEDDVSGQKFQFYTSYRSSIKSYVFYNFFVNHYRLSHYTDTALTRVGLGLSFIIQ